MRLFGPFTVEDEDEEDEDEEDVDVPADDVPSVVTLDGTEPKFKNILTTLMSYNNKVLDQKNNAGLCYLRALHQVSIKCLKMTIFTEKNPRWLELCSLFSY